MHESHIEDLVARYVKDGDVVSIGSSDLGEKFLKKLALALAHEHIPIDHVEFIPTSMRNAAIASTLGIPIADINEREVDVALEFVDLIDENYNFIKRNSLSFVRDKMIAQSAGILIAIADEGNMVKKLRGMIPFEIATFGWKRTMNQLDSLGTASRRMNGETPFKTETGNYVIDVDVDHVFSYEDLEFESKQIPGVLETGLFIGFADKIILHGKKIQLLSRTEFK
ncbi:MAG TPA: ribose 5-phosphate isomerase A [archaeon]|nr:ribose 5-phosphate isomerase A [archaeon]